MKRLLTNSIVIHHSVTPGEWGEQKTVGNILHNHTERGLAYDGNISYHFLIGKDWTYTGRPIDSVGYHAGHWTTNLSSVAICLVGNFNDDIPTKYQEEELVLLIGQINAKYRNPKIKLHRDIKATACPGKNITLDYVDKLLRNGTLPDMKYKELYEKELAKHKESIEEKNKLYSLWQEQINRANALQATLSEQGRQFRETIQQSNQHYNEWQRSLDRLAATREDLKSCEEGRLKDLSTLEKIRALFL